MKSKILLVTVFVLGVTSGVFVNRRFVTPPLAQPTAVNPCQNKETAVPSWHDTDDDTRTRMARFQQRLEQLGTQTTLDTVERLTKEMDAQRGIYDILIKYREAQQAKFVPFQTLLGVAGGAIVTLLTTWLAKRKSKSRHTPGRLQANGG